MKAAIVQADKTVKIDNKPIPSLKPNEILLKIKAIGINPTDWKHVVFHAKPGDIVGCDYVGEVVEIGSDVPSSEVELGELRWAFCRGGQSPTRGAFAEYVENKWDLTSVVPPNITAQQAASLPIPLMTAVQALYLRLGLPYYPQKASGQPWILIWSGATAVGQYAIQLAKLSGLRVAVTASPSRWARLKALGAEYLVDYKDPDVVKKLKEATNDSIEYGLDCISKGETYKLSQLAFRPSGGHLVTLLFRLPDQPRTDVKTEPTLVYTALGQDSTIDGQLFATSAEDRALYVKWLLLATELLSDGKLKPMEVEVLGNLDDIQKALDLLRSGKNDTKIVLNVP